MGRSNRDRNDESTITVFGKSFAKAFGVSYITAKILGAIFADKDSPEDNERQVREMEARRRAEIEAEKKAREEEQKKIEEQERVLKAKKKAEAELRELEKYGGSMKEIIDNVSQRIEEDGGLDIFKF